MAQWRGAIARFERNTIEIRVLDIQECPAADLAICGLAVGTLRALVDERFCTLAEQQAWPAERLAAILLAAIRDGSKRLCAMLNTCAVWPECRIGDRSLTCGDIFTNRVADRPGRTPAPIRPWRSFSTAGHWPGNFERSRQQRRGSGGAGRRLCAFAPAWNAARCSRKAMPPVVRAAALT